MDAQGEVSADVSDGTDAKTDGVVGTDAKSEVFAEIDGADAQIDVVDEAEIKSDVAKDIPPDAIADELADEIDVVPEVDAEVDAPADVNPDPYKPGILGYARLDNLAALDDLKRVRWHPSGDFALILGVDGKVLRYDAGSPGVKLLTTLGKDVRDLDFAPSGKFVLILGTDSGSLTRLWKGDVGSDQTVTFSEDATTTLGTPVAIHAQNSGDTFAIGSSTSTVTYLQLWQNGKYVKTKAFSELVGLSDFMWTGAGKLAGMGSSDAIVTSHGYNGADSRTWVNDSGDIIGNGWSPGFGNAGGASWRPDGTFGILTATSTNGVYVYDGGWQMTTLSGVGNASVPLSIDWRTSGTRALAVGNAPTNFAMIFEYRSGEVSGYVPGNWVNQSIQAFDKTPWFAGNGTALLDVAWRPGTLCDEGLIVGTDTSGNAWSPNYGLVLRFWDLDDGECK